MPIRSKGGGGAVGSADVDFGGYKTYGFKRMATVPVAADIGADGLVLYEGTGAETYYGGTGDTTTGLSADYEFAYKITLPAGIITKVRLKCAGALNVKLALYDDDGNSGEPATQLVNWGAFAAPAGLSDLDVADYTVSAGDYWLGSLSETTQIRYANGTNPHRQKVRAYALGLESPWPNATDAHYSAYNFYEQIGVSPFVRRLYMNVNDTVIYFTPT